MKFRTEIPVSESILRIDHKSSMMLLGSCFSQNIGLRLQEGNFDVDVNPFGVLYNPASIEKSLKILLSKKLFTIEDLFEDRGVFNSFSHHSIFSSESKEECLNRINQQIEKSSEKLLDLDYLLVTFGTSFVFTLKETGQVVSNCHKIRADRFDRRRLSVSEIVAQWSDLLERLKEVNPKLKVIFTVSPIRHWKDGAHGNQLSKSILLLAIDELNSKYDFTSYFPAYELMMDDLRDYRFYAEDMLHPNEMAISYIWGYFKKTYFDQPTEQILREWSQIYLAVNHRSQNENSKEYQDFLKNIMDKLMRFKSKYSYLDVSNLESILQARMRI